MANHVTEWLGAYHDGELHGTRLHQVEQHLAECGLCQAELNELRNLSALLQGPDLTPDFLLTERFVANLALRLPRRPEAPQARSAIKIGWWLIPVGLLGIWLFIDITFSLSSVLTLAADAGLFGGQLSWLQGSSLQMDWFDPAMELFGNTLGAPGRQILAVLNDTSLVITQLVGRWLSQAIVAVFYLGWLISLWFRHQQPSQNTGSFPNLDESGGL